MMKFFRHSTPPILGAAVLLLLTTLLIPLTEAAAQGRGDGARTQTAAGAGNSGSAAVSRGGSGGGGSSSGSSSSASSSGRSGGHHGHSGYHGGHGYHRSYSFFRPYISFYSYWGPYGYYYSPYYYPYYGHYYSSDRWGSLDLDVRPEKAEVYINGQRVGVADNYDGFPEYLWLKEGTYNVVFYHEGYETITRRVTVLPGIELDFQDRMEPGVATTPDELAESWMTEPEEALAQKEEASENEERWRDRARRYLDRRDDAGDRSAEAPPAPRNGTLDARGEPARLVLNLQPADASVYLDGRFLGTADELSRLHAGLLVDPGEHTLEVVHPSFRTERRTLEVDAGEELEIGFQLAAQ